MKVLIATLILIVSLAADEQPVKPQEWQSPTVWQNIKAGQSVKLLGDDPLEMTIDDKMEN